MYEMACIYCVVGKIHPFFQKAFESYKSHFSSDELDGSGNPITDKYIRNSLLGGIEEEGPVFSFWIDKESGELKQPSNAVEGFDSAVRLKWSEGVEYFYNQLEEKDKEKKLTEAIITLSHVQAVKKDAPILEFCVRNIADKDTLLRNLLGKDMGVYSLFLRLTDSCFFDTVHDLVQYWCYRGLLDQGDHSDKIFSQRDYELLLSLLSDVMLKNPESSVQARSLIMKIWECDRLGEYKKAAIIDPSNGRIPIKWVLTGLIVNAQREDVCKPNEEKRMEEGEIRDMILFAKKNTSPERFKFFKERVIKSLRLCGREGKKKGMDYGKLAEELLFSKLEREPLPARNGGSRVIVEAEDPSFSRSPIRHDASGDGPGSELESPDVSPSGSPERKKPFTPSGNK